MARISFRGEQCESGGQSVLDCLSARGHALAHACRAGVCQTCLMRARAGAIPARAQQGLSTAMKARGLFLACQCVPEGDMEVALADDVLETFAARVHSVVPLARAVCCLRLEPERQYPYRPGQFARLSRRDGTARNYSLASVPGLDAQLALHVGRVPGGRLSGWICEDLRPGDSVMLSEPRGTCFYTPERAGQDLLLIGGGTGLAPLYGIARDALHQGHRGRIFLYHGSRDASGLYLSQELHALAGAHPQLHVRQCVDAGAAGAGVLAMPPLAAALGELANLSGWCVYLCGSPGLVEAARLETFLAGAASSDIFADPFLPSDGATAPPPG